MAAYGALVSLMQILTALQPLDDRFFSFLSARQIPSLIEKVSFLLVFLESSSKKTSKKMMASLEKRIRDAAYAAEDLIVEPQFNEVLVSQLLSASSKEKSFLLYMIGMLVDNLIPAVKRVKTWVAKDMMFDAAKIPSFLISWVLKHLVFEAARFLIDAISWLVNPLMFVIESLMFEAANHLARVISCIIEFLMLKAAKFMVDVISWLVGHLIVEASTFLFEKVFENVIFTWAEIMGATLIRILLPVILKNVISAIVHNSIYGPLRHVYNGAILHLMIRVFESIVDEVTEVKDEEASIQRNVRPVLGYDGNDVVVGLENDLAAIRERLASSSMKREIVSIVGMGGIGKTTLARQAHDDSYIASHFYIRAWVAISQEYSLRNVLLGLLESAKILTQEMQEATEERLAVYICTRISKVEGIS